MLLQQKVSLSIRDSETHLEYSALGKGQPPWQADR
jgi:hypothetical protein